MAGLQDILLQMQPRPWTDPQRAWTNPPAPAGDSPIAVLLQSLMQPTPSTITSSPLMGAWQAAQQPQGVERFAPPPPVDTNRLFEVLTAGSRVPPPSPLAAAMGVPAPMAPVALPIPQAPATTAAPASPIKWGLPTAPAATAGPRSFTIGGGGTDDLMGRAMNAIKSIESAGSGDYAAIGPTHSKLGRALGAYQVMEANVGPWTKEALGKELTAEQFLADPAAQDAVFKHKFGQYVQKTGSPADAASMWFTGKPLAEGAGAKDVLGTTGQGYVDKFLKAMGTGGGNPMPGVPNISAPQLPIPSATIPLQGLPPNAFDAFNALKVTRPPPMETADRITNVLAQMAAGAMGGKDVGSTILGAGAGAAAGATQNIKTERKEAWDVSEKEDALKHLLARVGVQKAEAETAAQNLKIRAKNEDSQLLNQVKTEQAKLDQAAKNKVAEIQNDVDWKRWQMFEPQIKADKDGVTIIRRQQDGSMKVEMQKGNEMDALADRITDAGKIFGKDSQTVDTLRYTALARQGEPYLRRQIMRDMIDKNMAVDVLGKEGFDKLSKEAEKGLDQTLRGKPEEWDAQKKQRMIDLLWAMKMPDEAWLPKMLQKGNLGAMLLAQPGT